MQDQEAEANAVISQWQDSFNDSENRCSQLKEELENAKTEKESLETSLEIAKNDDKHFEEAKSSLDAQIATLEDAIEDELEDVLHVDNHEAIGRDTIEQLKEELKVAEDTLARDEDVVQQWEGKFCPRILKPAETSSNIIAFVCLLQFRPSCRT